jgi:hypothetical protein
MARHVALGYIQRHGMRTIWRVPSERFVAGIYARDDIERAVYKASADEVVMGARLRRPPQ